MPSKLCSPPPQPPPRHRSLLLLGCLCTPPPPLPKLATSHIVQNSGTEQGHQQRDPRVPLPRCLKKGSREGSGGAPLCPQPHSPARHQPGSPRPSPCLPPRPGPGSWGKDQTDGQTDGQPAPRGTACAPLTTGLRGPPGTEHGAPEKAQVGSGHRELAPYGLGEKK